jgi:hypothetical protein
MASRDIWSKRASENIQELLASLLVALLLQEPRTTPLFLCSPYLSDFRLLDNSFGQFADLFTHLPELADKTDILFSETLRELSSRLPIRIVTVQHSSSIPFINRLLDPAEPNLIARFAPTIYHEKGLLCNDFYVAGSMNFTYSGVYVRDEKITCHFAEHTDGRKKIDAAFLEFDLLWNNLGRQQSRSTVQ